MDLIARVLGKLRGASFLKGEGGTVVCAARRGLGGSSADVATLEGRPGAYRSGQTTPPSRFRSGVLARARPLQEPPCATRARFHFIKRSTTLPMTHGADYSDFGYSSVEKMIRVHYFNLSVLLICMEKFTEISRKLIRIEKLIPRQEHRFGKEWKDFFFSIP